MDCGVRSTKHGVNVPAVRVRAADAVEVARLNHKRQHALLGAERGRRQLRREPWHRADPWRARDRGSEALARVADREQVDAILDGAGRHEGVVHREGRVADECRRVQHEVAALVPRQSAVQLGEADVVANGQADPDAVTVKYAELSARRAAEANLGAVPHVAQVHLVVSHHKRAFWVDNRLTDARAATASIPQEAEANVSVHLAREPAKEGGDAAGLGILRWMLLGPPGIEFSARAARTGGGLGGIGSLPPRVPGWRPPGPLAARPAARARARALVLQAVWRRAVAAGAFDVSSSTAIDVRHTARCFVGGRLFTFPRLPPSRHTIEGAHADADGTNRDRASRCAELRLAPAIAMRAELRLAWATEVELDGAGLGEAAEQEEGRIEGEEADGVGARRAVAGEREGDEVREEGAVEDDVGEAALRRDGGVHRRAVGREHAERERDADAKHVHDQGGAEAGGHRHTRIGAACCGRVGDEVTHRVADGDDGEAEDGGAHAEHDPECLDEGDHLVGQEVEPDHCHHETGGHHRRQPGRRRASARAQPQRDRAERAQHQHRHRHGQRATAHSRCGHLVHRAERRRRQRPQPPALVPQAIGRGDGGRAQHRERQGHQPEASPHQRHIALPLQARERRRGGGSLPGLPGPLGKRGRLDVPLARQCSGGGGGGATLVAAGLAAPPGRCRPEAAQQRRQR
eukprot:scaffold12183_cov68-Phaeocystis_antarctica.AAC.3